MAKLRGGGVRALLYSLGLAGEVLVGHDLAQLRGQLGLHVLKVLSQPFQVGGFLGKGTCWFPKRKREKNKSRPTSWNCLFVAWM